VIEDESLEDAVIEDESLEDAVIEDESLEDAVIEDESLEDAVIEDEPLEDAVIEDEPLEETLDIDDMAEIDMDDLEKDSATDGMAEIDIDDFSTDDFDISSDENQEKVILTEDNDIFEEDITEENSVDIELDEGEKVSIDKEPVENLDNQMTKENDFDENQFNKPAPTGESNKNNKLFSLTALSVGIVGLMLSGGAIFLNSSLNSDVDIIQNTVLDVEDRVATIESNSKNENIDVLEKNIKALKVSNDALSEKILVLESMDSNMDPDDQAMIKTQLFSMQAKIANMEEKMTTTKGIPKSAFNNTSSASVEKDIKVTKKVDIKPIEVVKKKVIKKPRKVTRKKSVGWVVNLASFKQRWYTDKKVSEFRRKGIPTEVMSVDIKGVEWFRIRVVGFDSKSEARHYAEKVKKSLNLASAWISKK